MKYMMRVLFLTAALMASSNVFCMEDQEKLRLAEEERAAKEDQEKREGKEGKEKGGEDRDHASTWAGSTMMFGKQYWLPLTATVGGTFGYLWRNKLSDTLSWGKGLWDSLDTKYKVALGVGTVWAGWYAYVNKYKFMFQDEAKKAVDDVLAKNEIVRKGDLDGYAKLNDLKDRVAKKHYKRHKQVKVNPILRDILMDENRDVDGYDLPNWVKQRDV